MSCLVSGPGDIGVVAIAIPASRSGSLQPCRDACIEPEALHIDVKGKQAARALHAGICSCS
jgi:hypothetical protein